MDKTIAKEYFRQFGELKRVVFRPKVQSCTAEYYTQEGFLNALNNAGEYKGSVFKVSAEKTSGTKKKKVSKSDKRIWIEDNEIEAELEAMFGVGHDSENHSASVPVLIPEKKEKKTRLWNVKAVTKRKSNVKEGKHGIQKG